MCMRPFVWWFVVLLAVLAVAPRPAAAQDPKCPTTYAIEQFHGFLRDVDVAFLETNFTRATALLDAGQPNLPCIVTIVPTEDIAKYAIRRAYALELDLDENEAQRWAALAFALDPKMEWPAYIPPDHATRKMLDNYPMPERVTLDGKGFRIDEGGGVFLDGRWLDAPQAEQGIPHLLQVGDPSGAIVDARWIDGTAFPEDLLGPPPRLALERPRWYGNDGRIRNTRPWTERRLRRLESSIGFAIAAGTLYGSAALARQAYNARPVDGLYATVNGSIVASAAAGGTALTLFGVALFGK